MGGYIGERNTTQKNKGVIFLVIQNIPYVLYDHRKLNIKTSRFEHLNNCY